MQKRVKFDFAVDFSNGGGMQGQGFRLDIPGDDISDRELADYIVSDMRLLMVGDVRILKKEIISEPHKRSAQPGHIDLSHTIYDGLVTYKGLPAPIICDYLSREASRQRYTAGTEFQIGKIEMVANTGTYVDSPFHRFADGKDLSEVGLEAFADLEGVLVRADYRQGLAVTADAFKGLDVRNRAVLVHTGWAERWATEAYLENHPFLTEDAAVYLRDHGAKLVGIDSHNIDDTRGGERPVHSTLLRAEIIVAEHLCNLESVPGQGFSFSAIPPKFKGMGTFPVRAFARLS
ncbi:MAG TPA: cyclase family protein [Anaerolineales bacterium]